MGAFEVYARWAASTGPPSQVCQAGIALHFSWAFTYLGFRYGWATGRGTPHTEARTLSPANLIASLGMVILSVHTLATYLHGQ